MKILALDSSSKALSVALVAEGQLLGELTLNVKQNHSSSLMTAIDFLMRQSGLLPAALDRIAVAQGPGSYTGLRLAVTVGKTLAYSLKKEIVGISSLYAVAAQLQDPQAIVVPLLDARRGNAYAAVYQNKQLLVPDQHCDFSVFLTELSKKIRPLGQVVFTGETEHFAAMIEAAGFERKQIIFDSRLQLPAAYEIAKAAEKQTAVPVHSFNPNYLKKVEAEERWLETHEETKNATDSYVQRI